MATANSLTGQRSGAGSLDIPSVPLAVVILTKDEEENILHALRSVTGWAAEVWVVDAGSTDRTVSLAEAVGAKVVTHEFSGYAAQRNWALRNLPFGHEWVLFLDADEQVSAELRAEISQALTSLPDEVAGLYVKRRFIFLGRWLRHGGYYPVWLLRIVRHRRARCENRLLDEHLVVDGLTRRLHFDLVHEDRRGLERWVARHLQYAELAALELGDERRGDFIPSRPCTEQEARSRWWYERVYRRLPAGYRALGYFLYRYLLRGGFLDGREGLIYHGLQACWFRLLVDAKVLERERFGAEVSEVGLLESAGGPNGTPPVSGVTPRDKR